MRYPIGPDRGPPYQTASDTQGQVRNQVAEALESACLAIKFSRRREDFPALLDLVLAAKNAEEAVEA